MLQLQLKSLYQKRETAVDRVIENERRHLRAQEIFRKESADVEKLEQQSLSTFLQSLLGNYEEKLDQEKQEQVAAKIELDTAASLHFDAEEELRALDLALDELEETLEALEVALRQADAKFDAQMVEKEQEKYLMWKQEEKELDEAIVAGESVLNAIDGVLVDLDSANSMATMDMFMDSFLVGLMKFNKIDQAERQLANLERLLERYQKELKDVHLETSVAYEELGEMNRMFDIFFDNIFSDWNTKDTIRRNVAMLEEMMAEIEDVQDLLLERERSVKEQIQSIEK